jgi:hypothetical protein
LKATLILSQRLNLLPHMLNCHDPTLREVWGHRSHSRKWDLGVLQDSRKRRTRLQGPKHLTLRCSSYPWKGLEVQMSKMASHKPFRHPQHELEAKEGPVVKLAVWFPTTKSRESTRPWCVQVKCHTPLESFQRGLQDCFRPHPNRRLERRAIRSQSPESPNRDNFGTPLRESRENVPFECRCGEDAQRILYGGRWWLPPSPGRGESSESELPVACPNTKGVPECELTNLLVGFGYRTE